jgi:hypothetical protein
MSEIEPNGIEQPRVNLRLGMEFDLKVLVSQGIAAGNRRRPYLFKQGLGCASPWNCG